VNEKLVAVKNKAGSGTLYRSYSISSVPQTVFTDSSGEEIGRIRGYRAPAQFQQQMELILGDRVT
jgi:thioredoxin-related protein